MLESVKSHISPHAAGLRAQRWRWLVPLCLALTARTQAQQPANPEVELTAELRVSEGNNSREYQFVPANRVQQGQEIYYTVRIRNPGTATLDNVSIVRAIPANTRYVPGSATGAGADIQFSIDGGLSFAKSAELKSTTDPGHVAAANQYTHIRWQLRYPLPPKAVLLARFRAVFH